MRMVTPYQDLMEAKHSLDNGGRFYNLFTHADDQEITSAEFSKASKTLGIFSYSMLHYCLATQLLSDTELSSLESLFADKLKSKVDDARVPIIDVEKFPLEAAEGTALIIQGSGEAMEDDGMVLVSSMIGNMITYIPGAVSGYYDVLKISQGEKSCRVLAAKGTEVDQNIEYYWGGFVRRQVDESGKDFGSVYLEAQLYSEVKE